MARALIVIGLVIFLVGVAWYYAPWLFSWVGRLPGDIHFRRGNTDIFIPITSMIVLSIILSIISAFFRFH